jgi:hypothetical protein
MQGVQIAGCRHTPLTSMRSYTPRASTTSVAVDESDSSMISPACIILGGYELAQTTAVDFGQHIGSDSECFAANYICS